jgi:acid stress chaperone HdeB
MSSSSPFGIEVAAVNAATPQAIDAAFAEAAQRGAGQAQVSIDISKITCDQFMGYKIINPYYLAMWLSDCYNGQRGNTIIDTETLAAQTRILQDYCLHNAKVPVVQAIDKLFHK